MSQEKIIEAQERVRGGTGAARAVRREGMIPGIVYGEKKSPEMISVDLKTIMTEAQHANFFSKLYTLKVGSNSQRVIAKDLQVHAVTETPMHIDFQRIGKDSKVHIFVPVHFVNEDKAPAIKLGGALNIIIHNLEMYCPADSIPEQIEVDLTGLEMHQSITLDAVKLPKGAKLANAERDHVIASVVAPSGMEEKASSEEASA